MKKTTKVIVSVLLCFVMVFMSTVSSLAVTTSEIDKKISAYKSENQKLQNEINKLKKEQSQQSAVLSALQKKISNIQSIINTYNDEISRINSIISTNKEKINAKEAEIAQDKLDYKKRIRAIYMSQWDSSLKLMLDANSFADFLQLQKLTEAVSAKDKKFMEKLNSEIEELNAINDENRTLLEKQVALKNEVKAQQDALKSQESEAASVYNSITKDVNSTQSEKNSNDKAIADLEKQKRQIEAQIGKSNAGTTFINPNTGFMWPVAGYYMVSSPFGPRWGKNHNGIDIAGSGIAGRPILAIADGVVEISCSDGWGGGYGNYCSVNHGTMTINGSAANYVAFYAHATRVIVSVGQKVKQGQVLGYVGTTGHSTGYHLHIGIKKNGSWVNPYPLLRG